MYAVPLDGGIGVELKDVDFGKPFTDDDLRVMRDAFDDGAVILVRVPGLTDEQQDAFVSSLGELHTFRWGTTVEYLSNVIEDNPSLAGSRRLLFHNDGAYRYDVASGTCLYAQDVSPTSPPTAFADSVRAYESLPDDVKAKIENLHGYNMFDTRDVESEQHRMRLINYPADADMGPVQVAEHPIVITVPHTGKKALFVNEFNTSHIVEFGPDSEEGEALLQMLFKALYDDANTYAHHYRNGDLVLFNNFAVQHARTDQVDNNPRTLRRLVLKTLNW